MGAKQKGVLLDSFCLAPLVGLEPTTIVIKSQFAIKDLEVDRYRLLRFPKFDARFCSLNFDRCDLIASLLPPPAALRLFAYRLRLAQSMSDRLLIKRIVNLS